MLSFSIGATAASATPASPRMQYIYGTAYSGINYTGGIAAYLGISGGPEKCVPGRTSPNSTVPFATYNPGLKPPAFRSIRSPGQNCHKIQFVLYNNKTTGDQRNPLGE